MGYSYKIYSTGNALFSIYEKKEGPVVIDKSIFDIGYSDDALFDAVPFAQYSDAKTFVLSHFHRDHFNGLNRLRNNSLCLEKVVIPKLPFDELHAQGLMSFFAIELFYYAQVTGFYETDLLNIIARKNNRPLEVQRKSRNENFVASDVNFKAIWPDQTFLINRVAIQRALREINQVIQENTGFKKFYQGVMNSGVFNEEIEVSPLLEGPAESFDVVLTPNQRDLIRTASRRLINNANDICLAFQDENTKFLSLGDLSNRALDRLFELDFNTQTEFEVVLSAHHGTHYSTRPNWTNIQSCVVVHSNGINMGHYFRNEYLQWSINQHQTSLQGNFISDVLVRECRLNKVLSKKAIKTAIQFDLL